MTGNDLAHYRILEKIGAGGMGEVYRATDTTLQRDVALKVLPPDLLLDARKRKRLVREARAGAAVNHPQIATVLEVGEADGIVFIAMELVDGESLRARLRETGVFPVDEAIRIARDVADGLSGAHAAGVVHRDLKPENVMLRHDGHVKILDFGLALVRAQHPSRTIGPESLDTITVEQGRVLGTPAYMSPEQARGEEVDARSDIFSLGAVMYEMLAGVPPFEGTSATEVLSAILRDDPGSCSTSNRDVSPELDRIVAKCLEKNPRDRYQHADELVVDLSRLRRTTQSGSVRPGAPPAGARRLRITALVLAALGLTLVVAQVMRWDLFGKQDSPVVAVLFFENLGPPEDDYFTAGLTEDMITKLSQVHQLKVLSRTILERYGGRQIDIEDLRRDQHIGYYLEGSVRRKTSNLAVNTKLIDAGTGFPVWARTFEGSFDQIFAVQDTITMSIARALGVRIESGDMRMVARRWTDNAEAYAYYLTGREMFLVRRYYSPDWSVEPSIWFGKALQLDPDYAPAMAGTSHALTAAWSIGQHRPGQLERAAELAERAIEVDPQLWDARLAAATVPFQRGRSVGEAWADLNEAARQLEAITKEAPEYGEGYYYLGWVREEQRRPEAALANYLKAWELTDRTSIFRNVMRVSLDCGRINEAESTIGVALTRHPDDADLMYARIRLLARSGRRVEAIEVGSAALSHHPDHYHLRYSLARDLAAEGRTVEADSVFAYALEQWPRTAEVWQDAAEVSRNAGDLGAAKERLQHAIEVERYHYGSWRNLSSVLNRRGEFDEQEALLREAIGLWPDDWRVHADLASMYQRSGRMREAEQILQGGSERIQGHPSIVQRRAALYVDLNRYQDADAVIRSMVERWPTNPDVLTRAATLYRRMSMYDAAERCARLALDTDPSFRGAHTQLGWSYLGKGNLDDAIQSFREAIAIGPPNRADYLGLSQAQAEQRRWDEAARTLEQFVVLRPLSVSGWRTLGMRRRDAGDAYGAVTALENALELDPDDVYTLNRLADAYFTVGRTERCLESYERSARLDTTNAYPWLGIASSRHFALADDEGARSALRKALALATNAGDSARALTILGSVQLNQGDGDQGLRTLERAGLLAERLLARAPDSVFRLTATSYLQAKMGNCDRAMELIEECTDRVDRDPAALSHIGCIMALCGDRDRAFEFLHRSIDSGWSSEAALRNDPDLENLRADPRFEALVKSVR